MDMTREAMTKVEELAAPKTFEIADVHGVLATYSSKELTQVIAEPPHIPSGIEVSTLAGLADLVRANMDGKTPEDYFLHVVSEHCVLFRARACDSYGRRHLHIKASPVPFRGFAFGEWISQEDFAINLASLFADSKDFDYVLKAASSITGESTSTSNDNGFTQVVSMKSGLRLHDSVVLKPRVVLAPFRTFPEVKQPESEFVFRARVVDGRVSLKLVEADGGVWKLVAIRTIAEYLKTLDLGTTIVA